MRTRLRHVAQINPPSRRFDRLPDDALVPFLPMENIWPGQKLNIAELRPKAAVAVGYTRFESGDVIVPKITPTFEASRSVLVPEMPTLVGTGTTELHVVRPEPGIDPRYLLYVFHSHDFLKIGEAAMYGVAGQKRIPDELIRDWAINLPPLDEQHRIADFLDVETSRMDCLKDYSELQQSLLGERFMESVRIRTTGVAGPRIRTGIEWMPETNSGWTIRKVSREFRTSSGTTPSSDAENYFGGPYPWVNSSDLWDGEIRVVERTVTGAALEAYPALRVQPAGSLIIAMYGQGETKGRTGILTSAACLNQACCALIRVGRVLTEFAAFWFRAHKAGVISLAHGAGQPNLSQELIRQLMIPAPDVEAQERIVAQLRLDEAEHRTQSSALAQRCELLNERRQALITAAVTGQIDVTTARGVVP